MKYVVFLYKSVYMPVVVPEHVTHSQIKILEAKPVSAGFFKVDTSLNVTVYGKSESLNLEPHARDKKLLENVFLNFGTAQFLTINTD